MVCFPRNLVLRMGDFVSLVLICVDVLVGQVRSTDEALGSASIMRGGWAEALPAAIAPSWAAQGFRATASEGTSLAHMQHTRAISPPVPPASLSSSLLVVVDCTTD